jgi:transcriptional regulator with XRE-family HTH domain
LALAAGIDFTYLSKLENGHGEPPSEETIRRLARELGGDAEELLALAVKVPESLKARASNDPDLALLLTRLPAMPSSRLRSVYRAAGIGGTSRSVSTSRKKSATPRGSVRKDRH